MQNASLHLSPAAVASVPVIKGSKQKRAHSSEEHGVQDGTQLAGKSSRASRQMIPHFSPLQPQRCTHLFVRMPVGDEY